MDCLLNFLKLFPMRLLCHSHSCIMTLYALVLFHLTGSDLKLHQCIYKGGAEDDPTNYQLIAVVSIIAKILEKIVASQLQLSN